jgi:hypothetical protein
MRCRRTRTEHRAHDIEAAVLEQHVLGITLDELGLEALGLGALSGALEQRGDVVEADDRTASSSCGQRGVSAAGRNVEHALGRANVERLDHQLRHDEDLCPDHVVVAARPGGLLPLFDRGQIWPRCDLGHRLAVLEVVNPSRESIPNAKASIPMITSDAIPAQAIWHKGARRHFTRAGSLRQHLTERSTGGTALTRNRSGRNRDACGGIHVERDGRTPR